MFGIVVSFPCVERTLLSAAFGVDCVRRKSEAKAADRSVRPTLLAQQRLPRLPVLRDRTGLAIIFRVAAGSLKSRFFDRLYRFGIRNAQEPASVPVFGHNLPFAMCHARESAQK